MFLFQKLWIKKHKKHLILFSLLLVLWTLALCSIFYFFYAQQELKWRNEKWRNELKLINKYIEAERRAEACLPMQPKIPIQKILI